ncbi:D-alanine aminotransferase [Thermotalea metallivorans]|uniref:D-alanine aminotransferase n=2 Tax=Thermotalea metallivorans TaxID=520762 RepID=A0A140L4Q1_9FIRM|nr:D-alanine aminotransferase [Thermotalea metallivorans]
MYISLNGKIIKDHEAGISPVSEGFMYGYGLFETVKVQEGKMYFFTEHMERLRRGCSILEMKLEFSPDVICQWCDALIDKNNLFHGGVRIAYTKNGDLYDLLITTREHPYPKEQYEKGWKVCFSPMKRNPESLLAGIKSNNYLENILSLRKAKEKGYDEAIFLNVYGKITEGAISNIFFVKNHIVYTPSAACGILRGIMRDKVIHIMRSIGVELQIGQYAKEEIYEADEIFATNSLIDIMPVSQLENKKFDLQKASVTIMLMEELRKFYDAT